MVSLRFIDVLGYLGKPSKIKLIFLEGGGALSAKFFGGLGKMLGVLYEKNNICIHEETFLIAYISDKAKGLGTKSLAVH